MEFLNNSKNYSLNRKTYINLRWIAIIGQLAAINIAKTLLNFVAVYVLLDSVQLILAGALRGAGDTWFVLVSGLLAATLALVVGFTLEPQDSLEAPLQALNWWWWMLTLWIWLLATFMTARFLQGRWKRMRMV